MAGARVRYTNIWASGGGRTDPGGIKIDLGWVAEKPPYQYQNFLNGRTEDMLAYLESKGVAAWHTDTPYEDGAVVTGSDQELYLSLQANTAVDPIVDAAAPTYAGANWRRVAPPTTTSSAGLIELATQAEVDNGVATDLAVTPETLEARTASTTRTGIIEIALGSEAAALSDPNRAISPLALASVVATATSQGIAELATHAEAMTGTDAARVVTPESIGTLGQSLAAAGYKTLPGGLILQWGSDVVNNDINHNVTLPIAFPTLFASALASSQLGGINENNNDAGARPDPDNLLTRIRLSSGQSNRTVRWLAIGY